MRNEKGSTMAISRTLAKGGILAVMMDRNSSGRRLLVPFLGQGMMMPLGPAVLAHRFGAAVFAAGCRRGEDGRTRVSFRRVDTSGAEDGEAFCAGDRRRPRGRSAAVAGTVVLDFTSAEALPSGSS